MPITPGSSSKLNSLYGLSSVMVTTASEEVTLANKVLPAGLLLKKSDSKIYLTDGVSTLANLPILIDQILANVEKAFLSSAVSNNAYARAAGGVVVHNSNGKIDDDSLNIVTSGKITESYLSDYIDPVTHKVLLSALPDTVRAGVTYVEDIDARNALSAEQKKSLAFVIDATDDETVTSGAAMYGWDATANSNAGAWVKIAEVESMDLDVAALRCDYTNTEAAGAVMYDHMVHLTPTTAVELATIYTGHDETPEYSELGWESFITGVRNLYSGPTENVYLAASPVDLETAVLTMPVISDDLNLANSTLTITNVNDDTVTYQVIEKIDVSDTGVVDTGYRSSDENEALYRNPLVRVTLGFDPEQYTTDENVINSPLNMVITDGTHTYVNNTITGGELSRVFEGGNYTLTIDSDSGWQLQ